MNIFYVSSPDIQIDVDGNDPGDRRGYLPVVEGDEVEHVPGVLVGADHHHSTVQCSTVQYSTLQYSTVQYSEQKIDIEKKRLFNPTQHLISK